MAKGGQNKKLSKVAGGVVGIDTKSLPFVQKPDPQKWTRHKVRKYFNDELKRYGLITSNFGSAQVDRLGLAGYILQIAMQQIDEDPIAPRVNKVDAYRVATQQQAIIASCLKEAVKGVYNVPEAETKAVKKSPTELLAEWGNDSK